MTATAKAVQDVWQQPTALPPLATGAIHIWRLLPEAYLESDAYLACLRPDERERAGRLLFSADQQQSIASRGTLRLLLAHYTGAKHPRDLEFAYGAQGKPYLPGSSIHFNLSHTRGIVVIAFAHDIALGVDVERIVDSHDLDDVARQNFAPAEYDALSSLSQPEQIVAFYRCWTRKEALLKAEGSGLFRALDSFAVSLLPGAPAEVIAGTGDGWDLRHLDLLPGAVGAIAWPHQQPSPAITLLDCSRTLLSTED